MTIISGNTGINKVQDGSISNAKLASNSVTSDKIVDATIQQGDMSLYASSIGVGQTWQSAELTNTGALFTDGTPKYRTLSNTYTNNTGKPINVSVALTVNSTTGYFRVKINGTTMYTSTQVTNGYFTQADVIIPNGSSYLIEPVNAVLTGSYWAELR